MFHRFILLNRILPSPGGRECEKKLSPVQRAGRDIAEVLQRYLFTLTTYNKKLYHVLTTYRLLLPLPSQRTAFVKLWRYSCPPGNPNLFRAHPRPNPCLPADRLSHQGRGKICGYHSLSGKMVSSGWTTLSMDFIAIRFTMTLIMSLRYQASPRIESLG